MEHEVAVARTAAVGLAPGLGSNDLVAKVPLHNLDVRDLPSLRRLHLV